MKYNIFFSVFFLALVTSGCKNSSEPVTSMGANGEGMVTYKISYPENNPYKNVHLLPRETHFFFKNNRASFITSFMGMAEMVNLLDNDKNKFTSLLITGIGRNYAYTDSPEDVKKQESNPQYKIETTRETKIIAGLECRKAVVGDLTNHKKFDIYYYEKIKVYLGNSPYKNFNFLLMEYDDTRYGLTMHLQATKVDFRTIDTTMLSVHGNYTWVDKKTFISIIKEMSQHML